MPKKVATGVAAIAGVGALIGIPVLTFNPMRPPSALNEDAYYQSRVSNRGASEGNGAAANLDSASLAEIPINSSNPIPGIASQGSVKTFDTSDTPSNIGENTQLDPTARSGNPNNPYSKSSPSNLASSRYSAPDSLSTNPYNASNPGGSVIKTPYSLPVPKSATPYSLQPSQGNVYPELNSKPTGSNNNPNATANPNSPMTSSSVTRIIPSTSAIAPNTLNGASGDDNPTGGYR